MFMLLCKLMARLLMGSRRFLSCMMHASWRLVINVGTHPMCIATYVRIGVSVK